MNPAFSGYRLSFHLCHPFAQLVAGGYVKCPFVNKGCVGGHIQRHDSAGCSLDRYGSGRDGFHDRRRSDGSQQTAKKRAALHGFRVK